MDCKDVAVLHTPAGGFGDRFPDLALPGCTHPLAEGAPDLRGFWAVVSATRAGQAVEAGDPILRYVERIEQCGNRVIDMGGGTIADCRADGSEEHGVHDVSAFDFTTPIHVVATFEDGAFILRPVGLEGLQVTRELNDAGQMVWTRPDGGGLVAVLERRGDGAGQPANPFRLA